MLANRWTIRGARVIYFYQGEKLPVFLLAFFAKNERSDLSVKESAALAALVRKIAATYGR